MQTQEEVSSVCMVKWMALCRMMEIQVTVARTQMSSIRFISIVVYMVPIRRSLYVLEEVEA